MGPGGQGVGGLAYSGKIMTPTPFTPAVAAIRDELYEETGELFDCALLNLYPDGSTVRDWCKLRAANSFRPVASKGAWIQRLVDDGEKY